MSIHGSRVFALWVVEVLTDGGLAVALGGKPTNVPAGKGWGAVYPLAGGTVDGSIGAPNADATPNVQVTSVSYNPEQALWHADKVRHFLLAAVPASLSDGRRVIYGEPSFSDPTLARDDDVSPATWYCPDRFSFMTTPMLVA